MPTRKPKALPSGFAGVKGSVAHCRAINAANQVLNKRSYALEDRYSYNKLIHMPVYKTLCRAEKALQKEAADAGFRWSMERVRYVKPRAPLPYDRWSERRKLAAAAFAGENPNWN